jgi:hypothetical protein
MMRYAGRILAVVSMLLCAATLFLAIGTELAPLHYSYAGKSQINPTSAPYLHNEKQKWMDLAVGQGEVRLTRIELTYQVPNCAPPAGFVAPTALRSLVGPTPWRTDLASVIMSDIESTGVNLWLAAVLSGLAPLVYFVQRRRHMYPKGSFRACGYDLRATPQKRPECGMDAT